MRRCAKPELANAGEPDAVSHVGFSALQLLHLMGMHQDWLDTGALQRLEWHQPVDPGPFHDCGLDVVIGIIARFVHRITLRPHKSAPLLQRVPLVTL